MSEIPFIGPAYTLRSKNLDAQRCINLYPEVDQHGGKNTVALVGTPGLTESTDLDNVPWLATFKISEIMGAVCTVDIAYCIARDTLRGNKGILFFKDSSGWHVNTFVKTNIDPTPKSHISMAISNTHVMFVDGTDGFYRGHSDDWMTQITAAGFPANPETVTFQDGYFIVSIKDSQAFYISGLNDPSSWSALAFASKEGGSDNLKAVFSDHRELWLFGNNTTEVWYNSGAEFPFSRISGVFIETGIAAKHSIAKVDNSIMWLAADARGQGVVVRADGYNPQVVSTRAIEYAIAQYSDISDAFAFSYQQEGHMFYVLTFPTGDATWVYDASTQMWHERWYGLDRQNKRILANCYIFFGGEHIVGSRNDGKLFKMDLDVYTDNSTTIKRLRSSPHIHNDRKRLFFSSFEVDIESGIGLATGQGSDPQMMMRFSDDGGHSWSNEKWSGMGKIGKRNARCIWRRLGQSRDRIFEVSVSDPVKTVIINAHADVKAGKN